MPQRRAAVPRRVRKLLEMELEVSRLHFAKPYQHIMSSAFHFVEYRLMAFISHMGTSTMSGHYVCHIFKDGRWVIFNDNKVAQSVAPPKDLAYLYLYKRDV